MAGDTKAVSRRFGAKRFSEQRSLISASRTFGPLSDGGVTDEWVTQILRQGDAQVMKKYSQMQLHIKRRALEKLNRRAGETAPVSPERMCTVVVL